MKLLNIGGEAEYLVNSRLNWYYCKAIVTWSKPSEWTRDEAAFRVPDQWRHGGGVYAFLRDHPRQSEPNRIAYIGKALKFTQRLTRKHPMYERLVCRKGATKVCCGQIHFERIRARPGYYVEIEDIFKWVVWPHLHNKQGLESLPGFRGARGRPFKPWVIRNEGYRFSGKIPRLIAYPAIATSG